MTKAQAPMLHVMKARVIYLCLLAVATFCRANAVTEEQHGGATAPSINVLIFSKTQGFRHASIPLAVSSLKSLGAQRNWNVDATESSEQFTDANLAKYAVVVWLNTSGDVLNSTQKAAYERFHRSGKGTVAIHEGGTDTEREGWPWYRKLASVLFVSHPAIQKATLDVTDRTHPATIMLPTKWEHIDEWYNFDTVPSDAHVIINVDEHSYEPGPDAMETAIGDHPIAWYKEFDGGRYFYTALGHTVEDYTTDSFFLAHIAGAIDWAAHRPFVPDRGALILSEFDGSSSNGQWERQAPSAPDFKYEVEPTRLYMQNTSILNQHLVRKGTAIDPNRPYAIEGTFSILRPMSPMDSNSFAVNFNVAGADGDQNPINTWSLNVDLNGNGEGGVMKFMGFHNGAFAEIGHLETNWGKPETEYSFRIYVNADLNAKHKSKIVSMLIKQGDLRLEEFQVDYSAFPYQPDQSRSTRLGFNTHGANWVLKNLKVYYLDVLAASKWP